MGTDHYKKPQDESLFIYYYELRNGKSIDK